MKHLKLFENFDEIESICKKFGITNWKVNPDGLIDVYGSIDLRGKGLNELPLKFGKVNGYFNCSWNKLETLEGCPKEVGNYFNCSMNKLESLKGGPSKVGLTFDCCHNKLTSLEGVQSNINGNFSCSTNLLTTLEGGPKEVSGDFWCINNQLTTLKGSPNKVGGNFDCSDNPIFAVYNLFPDYKSFMDSLDYNYLRGKAIVKRRLEEALDELGIKVPKFIPGYKYI